LIRKCLSAFLGGVDFKLPRFWFQRSFLEAALNAGKLLFAKLMDFLPWTSFARSVTRYGGDRRVRNLSCAEQFRAMAFAQLTYRESLRDIEITAGDKHDVHILDEIVLQPGAYYIMDRGYLDFFRLHRIHLAGAFFVTRAKSNLDAGRIYSRPAGKQDGILADQSIALHGYKSRKAYPGHLRRVRFRDPETGKNLVFLTIQFTLPAATICALYKSRWRVELFFENTT
jgi:IS4 transposase